jgi:hypothetical protein
VTASNDPDLIQFSFGHVRIAFFTVVHTDLEISRNRFSGPNTGTGFDPFQNEVAEIGRTSVLAFWQKIKNQKFLPSKNIANIDFLNRFSEVVLLEHHPVILPTKKIPNKINNTSSRLL